MGEPWLEGVKALMEERIAKDPDASFIPRLILRKNSDVQITFLCEDARLLAELARIASAGFEPDELILVSDSWYANTPTNPEGKEWEYGEMQRRSTEPAARALLREMLLLLRSRRSLDVIETRRLPYRREPGRIIWEPDPEEELADSAGYLPRHLIAAANEHAVLESAARVLGTDRAGLARLTGQTPERVTLNAQIAAAKMMVTAARSHKEHLSFAWAIPNQDGADQLKQVFGSMPGLEVTVLDPSKKE